MEIRERIESCRQELDSRKRTMTACRERVKILMTALQADGGTPGTLGEMLGVLESVLAHYDEISESCGRMVEGLNEIGSHIDRIEDGRTKIVNGVETILKNLSHLDKIAAQGLPLGVGSETEEGRPKRVLLVRLRPDTGPKGASTAAAGASEDSLTLDDDSHLPGRTTVH